MVTLSPSPSLDFGYPWWLSYGHLVVLVPAVAFLVLGYRRKWRRWLMVLLSGLAIWSGAAFLVTRFLFNANGIPPLPTESFFRMGDGRVLDIGAGTGRSSLMLLTARPKATLVALDLFGESFEHHFGTSQIPQQKLLSNLKVSGVDQRASVETGDMRALPFEPASFDAIVSAYAIDHLNREGIGQALAEAARVLKPGGDFLLILIANDGWAKLAYGPILSHGGTRGADWWTLRMQEAGFQVRETGSQPLTLYLLATRPPGSEK